jgi:hypothetical protein
MAIRISNTLWKVIQSHWEYDIDEPSHETAAARAAKEHKFTPPAKSNVYQRQKKEGWTRRGNMNGVNQAAQRKADQLVTSSGEPVEQNETKRNETNDEGKRNAVSITKAAEQSAKQEAEDRQKSLDVRTQVNVRHRAEWGHIVALRQEAFTYRDKKNYPDRYDLGTYYGLLKACKIAAEIIAIQQAGERKAWGMDVLIDPSTLKSMSTEQLEKIAAGGTV